MPATDHRQPTELNGDPVREGSLVTLVGCVLTKDEEHNIERAVASLQQVADIVFVLDSYSTDRTRVVAESCGAVVAEHAFVSYSEQRNAALSQISERWGADVLVLMLDADEWLDPALIESLRAVKTLGASDRDMFMVRRRVRFDGRILRHGGFGGTWIIRMWRAGYSSFGPRTVNELVDVPDGSRLVQLEGWLEHADVDSWEKYIDKHNRYSSLEAADRLKVRRDRDHLVTAAQAWHDRTIRRRFLRQRVWDRIPDGAKPVLRFAQVYGVSGGFLDGRSGFERALFEAWQEMCTDLKARELERLEEGP